MTAIAVSRLTKRFGDVVAVDDLSFEVTEGKVTGFLGRNGAGKTTTLRAILGLTAPTSGTATIGGSPYRDLTHPLRTVGAVLETSGFHPARSARDHLRIVAAAAAIPTGRVDAALAEVDLTAAADKRVGGFSWGMRQRLGLAAALLGEPEVLILDEPTNGLDPEGTVWLRHLVRSAAAAGRTVLLSSHALAEVAQTVDEVVIVAKGRLVARGPLPAVIGDARAACDVAPQGAPAAHRSLEEVFLQMTEAG